MKLTDVRLYADEEGESHCEDVGLTLIDNFSGDCTLSL
jgi:hypothetical protein